MQTVRFLLQLLGLSALISVSIKTLGPQLPLPGTPAIALTLVLAPSGLLGLVLLWRLTRFEESAGILSAEPAAGTSPEKSGGESGHD